jgi:putative sterol carrier protein
MATSRELVESLLDFAERCNGHDQLRVMNRAWERTLRLSVTDHGAALTLLVAGGSVSFQAQPPARYDMELAAESDLFCALFWGEIGPTEPYMDGRLMVKGTQEDLLRLDAITAMIWGE